MRSNKSPCDVMLCKTIKHSVPGCSTFIPWPQWKASGNDHPAGTPVIGTGVGRHSKAGTISQSTCACIQARSPTDVMIAAQHLPKLGTSLYISVSIQGNSHIHATSLDALPRLHPAATSINIGVSMRATNATYVISRVQCSFCNEFRPYQTQANTLRTRPATAEEERGTGGKGVVSSWNHIRQGGHCAILW